MTIARPRRSIQDMFAHPRNAWEHALAFGSCAGFYAAMGTLLASLIAWTLILIATAAGVLLTIVPPLVGGPGPASAGGAAAGLGVVGLSLLVTGAIGYATAPFVGLLIGWRAAIAISLAMSLIWSRPAARRYALPLSAIIGALGAFLVSSNAMSERFGAVLIVAGIAASSALSAALVTWIIRYWLEPIPDPASHRTKVDNALEP